MNSTTQIKSGALLALCLWLMPAVLPVNAASPGTVLAWGDNASGQTTIPVGLSGVTAIAAGSFHTVALVGTGAIAPPSPPRRPPAP